MQIKFTYLDDNGCVHNCTRGENVDLTIGCQRYYCYPKVPLVALLKTV